MKEEVAGAGRPASLRNLAFLSERLGRATVAFNALLALIIINFVLQPLTEPDFGWHLRAGLDFLKQGGRVPAVDPYSHTMPDWPWVEHAWLTDMLVASAYSAGGALAVMLLFGVLTAAAWLLAVGKKQPLSVRLSACALSLWVALPFLGARTQTVTWLGLALLMALVRRLEAGDPALLWGVPPLFLLWGNLHGGFTAGLFYLLLVVGLCWAVTLVLPKRVQGPVLPAETQWRLLLATGAGAALTLVNPYGIGLHKEIAESLSDRFMLDVLREWHPVSPESLAGRMFLVYLAGLACAMLAWYRRIEPVQWGVWAVFLLLACRHLRNIPLFLIVSLPLLADLLGEGLVRFTRHRVVSAVSGAQWLRAATLALGIFLLYLGPDHLIRVWRFGVAPAVAFRDTTYPIEAVEWVNAHRERLGARMVHDYQYGGFLLWWLPGEKVFIDGRMPAWRIGERWVFKDYVDILESDPPRVEVLDKYRIDWSLVKRASALARVLALDSAWHKEYEDEKVVIYARTTKALAIP